MGSITSQESSQNVSLMNANVCTTRKPSPPHSSRRTIVSALLSIAAFSFSISSSSLLSDSFAFAPGVGSRDWMVFATCSITNSRVWVKLGSVFTFFFLPPGMTQRENFLVIVLVPKMKHGRKENDDHCSNVTQLG